jgi:hypothetical protein
MRITIDVRLRFVKVPLGGPNRRIRGGSHWSGAPSNESRGIDETCEFENEENTVECELARLDEDVISRVRKVVERKPDDLDQIASMKSGPSGEREV